MPESEYEVEYFVRAAHESGQKLRVVSETHHALKLGVLQHDALIMCSVCISYPLAGWQRTLSKWPWIEWRRDDVHGAHGQSYIH